MFVKLQTCFISIGIWWSKIWMKTAIIQLFQGKISQVGCCVHLYYCLSVCDVLTFCDEIVLKIIVVVTYSYRTFLTAMFDPCFTCVKSLEILSYFPGLFYGFAHRKVNKSSDFYVLRHCVMWQTKLTELIWTEQLSKIFLKMLWNILKVVQFIAVANNNCIHVNKGEI